MATISKFKCSKCGKEFSLMSGVLMSQVRDIPADGKAYHGEIVEKLVNEKTTEHSVGFQNALMQHGKKCKGDVKFTGTAFAD